MRDEDEEEEAQRKVGRKSKRKSAHWRHLTEHVWPIGPGPRGGE